MGNPLPPPKSTFTLYNTPPLCLIGFAVVTLEWGAAIWTEPQFELLAQQQLDCNWQIMILGMILDFI